MKRICLTLIQSNNASRNLIFKKADLGLQTLVEFADILINGILSNYTESLHIIETERAWTLM